MICNICPHECDLEPGERGKCSVRVADETKIIDSWYGYCSAIAVDQIEKRPFYHLTPDEKYLSVSLFGCSMACGFCVPSDTLIRTKDSLKRIDQIQEGEEIIAFDDSSQQLVSARVGHVFDREVEEVLELEVDGQTLQLTPEHPVYTKSKGWVEAKSLTDDDEVLCDRTYLEQPHFLNQNAEIHKEKKG